MIFRNKIGHSFVHIYVKQVLTKKKLKKNKKSCGDTEVVSLEKIIEFYELLFIYLFNSLKWIKKLIDFQSVKNLFSVLLLVYYNRMQKSNFFRRKATFHSRRHDNYGSLLAKGRRRKRMQGTVQCGINTKKLRNVSWK